MDKAIETMKHNGLTINIFYDLDAESPREWDNNFGRMALRHNDFNFPNEADIDFSAYESWDEVRTALQKEYGARIILPVQMYEHGGVMIYVGNGHDQWDGSTVGFIYCTADDIRNNWDIKRITQAHETQAAASLVAEVDEYSKYLNGEVYGYQIEDEAGEELDSCYGFYGYDQVVKEAKDTATYYSKLPPKRKIAPSAQMVHA